MILEEMDLDNGKIPDNTPIYKYYSLESFLNLLMSKKLLFQSIKNWKDHYEGGKYDYLAKTGLFATDGTSSNYLGNCWTLQEYYQPLIKEEVEEQARIDLLRDGVASMWEQYCPNGGIRIQTTIEKIKKLIESDAECKCKLYRKKVDYSPLFFNGELISGGPESIKYLFYKKMSFLSESEYRFIIRVNGSAEKIAFISVPKLTEFVDGVLVSPAEPSRKWVSLTIYNLLLYHGFRNIEICQLYSIIGRRDL